jgi:hypothetical protein
MNLYQAHEAFVGACMRAAFLAHCEGIDALAWSTWCMGGEL